MEISFCIINYFQNIIKNEMTYKNKEMTCRKIIHPTHIVPTANNTLMMFHGPTPAAETGSGEKGVRGISGAQ